MRLTQTPTTPAAPARAATVDGYLERLRGHLGDVPVQERERLLDQARAEIELELELRPGDPEALEALLARMGRAEDYARRLRSEAPVPEAGTKTEGRLVPCRSCRREVSREALTCPGCGAPYPGRTVFHGRGYEWKSKKTLFGYPLVHVAFGRDANGRLRVARGIVAVGQFAIGAFTVAQFGVGLVAGIGQFVVAPIAVGQFALGLVAAGQFGIGLLYGAGMIATGLLGKVAAIAGAARGR